jgi:hypothetical protein
VLAGSEATKSCHVLADFAFISAKQERCTLKQPSRPVLNRLRQVRRLDLLPPRQVGNRARQLEDAVVGPRREQALAHPCRLRPDRRPPPLGPICPRNQQRPAVQLVPAQKKGAGVGPDAQSALNQIRRHRRFELHVGSARTHL